MNDSNKSKKNIDVYMQDNEAYMFRPLEEGDLRQVYKWSKEEVWHIPEEEVITRYLLCRDGWTAIEHCDRLIGFCAGFRHSSHGTIGMIYVAEEHQKKGLGELLINKTLAYIRAQNPTLPVYLHSVPTALNFYPKYGFVQTNRTLLVCSRIIKFEDYPLLSEGTECSVIQCDEDLEAVVNYDAGILGEQRSELLDLCYAYSCNSMLLVVAKQDSGEVIGYGCICKQEFNHKVTCLYADNAAVAHDVFCMLEQAAVRAWSLEIEASVGPLQIFAECLDANSELPGWLKSLGLEISDVSYPRFMSGDDGGVTVPWSKVYALTDGCTYVA